MSNCERYADMEPQYEGYPGTIGIGKKDRRERIAVGEARDPARGVATQPTLVIPLWGFLRGQSL